MRFFYFFACFLLPPPWATPASVQITQIPNESPPTTTFGSLPATPFEDAQDFIFHMEMSNEKPSATPSESPLTTPLESPLTTPLESPLTTPLESPFTTPLASPSTTPYGDAPDIIFQMEISNEKLSAIPFENPPTTPIGSPPTTPYGDAPETIFQMEISNEKSSASGESEPTPERTLFLNTKRSDKNDKWDLHQEPPETPFHDATASNYVFVKLMDTLETLNLSDDEKKAVDSIIEVAITDSFENDNSVREECAQKLRNLVAGNMARTLKKARNVFQNWLTTAEADKFEVVQAKIATEDTEESDLIILEVIYTAYLEYMRKDTSESLQRASAWSELVHNMRRQILTDNEWEMLRLLQDEVVAESPDHTATSEHLRRLRNLLAQNLIASINCITHLSLVLLPEEQEAFEDLASKLLREDASEQDLEKLNDLSKACRRGIDTEANGFEIPPLQVSHSADNPYPRIELELIE